MSSYFEDAWQQDNHDDSTHNVNIASKFVNKEKPLGILQSTKHSLQPDMLFGWRPKVASCPLPLRFPNPQTSKLLQIISQSDIYRIAYKNKHFVNSVQVNQSYNYYWKYRSRYSLNLALIQQAFKQQQKQIINPNKHGLQTCEYSFSSDFQCGNLDYAIRIKPNEYDCFLRSDSNTKGHCNWYFFSVKNHNRIGQIKINVCNISKTKNLYNKGMKPYVRQAFAGQDLNNLKQEWSQQICYNVEFVERICRYGSQTKRFQLQFKYNFVQPNMQVFFAYAIPYSYSKLQRFILQLSMEPQNSSTLVVQKLCQSLGGLNIPLLKITNNVSKQNQLQMHKRAIILSARIHPGQSHSSYVIEGLIRELLKDQDSMNKLREMFIFYIVPMINADGVVVGNYRTSYSGKDLNRQFKNLDQFIFPEITRLHELALQVRQKHFMGIQFYMDFHGHSSKKNLFTYGPQHSVKNIYYFKSKIFPKLIENFHPIFSYKKSNFKITEGKKTTARAHMLWKLKIPMVYTFEVSNGMYETKNKEDILLTQKILLQAGQAVLKAFFRYVRLQMGIPANLLSKKMNFIQTNKQNIKKRLIKSSKGIRDSSIGASKKKILKNGQIPHENYLSEKFLIDKMKYTSTTKKQFGHFQDDKIQQINQQQQLDEQTYQNLQNFMSLVDDVKNTKFELDPQGGSDSQSQGQDMDKEDFQKLYKNIKNSKLLKQLKQKKKPKNRYSKQQKSKGKKIQINDESNTNNNIFSEIKKELKKFKSYQLEELIKETKKLNNQMSYNNLNINKPQTLTKSPSVGDRLSRISARLYNPVNNIKENYHGEKQKITKIALVQKKFDLDL